MESMFAALILILLGTLYRVLPSLLNLDSSSYQNFSPLASIVLCGAIVFPKRMAILVPLTILLVSDTILNHFVYQVSFGWEICARYVVLGAIGVAAYSWREVLKAKCILVFGSAAAASVLFYLVTNTLSWAGDPLYSQSLAGWVQALTTGLPGYPPTWMFFRNSLVGDLLFTGLFLICMAVTNPKEIAHQAKPVLV